MDVAATLQAKGGDNLPLVDMLLQASEIISEIEKETDADGNEKS